MFQDIKPHILDNRYVPKLPQDNDQIVIYHNQQVLLNENGKEPLLPLYNEVFELWQIKPEKLIYLFSVDDIAFYLLMDNLSERSGYRYHNIQIFREMRPQWIAFAAITATHLASWYNNNRFCGKCAGEIKQKANERAIVCSSCNLTKYPQISPVIIVGVTNGEYLLLTKYAFRHKKYALVAGFVEIGETLEDAVKREVMEEVGLQVCNIRYYKSQPWAFSESLLMGFFADVKGSNDTEIDTSELSEATWFHRDALPKDDTPMSLTWDMIEAFRDRKTRL